MPKKKKVRLTAEEMEELKATADRMRETRASVTPAMRKRWAAEVRRNRQKVEEMERPAEDRNRRLILQFSTEEWGYLEQMADKMRLDLTKAAAIALLDYAKHYKGPTSVYLSVEEAAQVCGVQQTSVLHWLKKGYLRAGKNRVGEWTIHESELMYSLHMMPDAFPRGGRRDRKKPEETAQTEG